MHITLALNGLMFKPTCMAKLFSLSVFSWRCLNFVENTARSFAKSSSSSCEKGVYWMPLGLSAVVFHIIQSIVTRKRIGEMIQPCCTPDFTGNYSDKCPSTMALHLTFLWNNLISETIFGGTPQDSMIFHRVSRCKAFLKSIKLMCRGVFHLMHCSMM